MQMMTDIEARAVVLMALAQRRIVAELGAQQIVQAIAKHESKYGAALGGHNWGAVHCTTGPPCSDDCFAAGDRDAEGAGYPTCLRRYPSDVSGAADMARELYRRPAVAAALKRGDVYATAFAMGQRTAQHGVYHETAPSEYADALLKHVRAIAAANGEAVAVTYGATVAKPSSYQQTEVAGLVLVGAALVLTAIGLLSSSRLSGPGQAL